MTLAWPVTIDGRDYAVDLRQAQISTIEKIRQQADSSPEFGEQSLNPLDLWRRTQDDWSAGAGRTYLDTREDPTRRRFLESGRVDPWTRGSLSLSTAPAYYADLVAAIGLVVANAKIAYLIQDGADWKVFAVDGAGLNEASALYPGPDTYPSATTYPEVPTNSFVLLTTQLAEVAVDFASDGFYAYVLHENGVDQIDMDTGTNTSVTTQTGEWVGFVKGRLLIGDGENLYDASSGTATAITPSTINSNWTWTCAAESGQAIFVGGHGGERSTIFAVSVTEDGASLTAPVPAATLPYGEQIQAIYGYVDSVILGTTHGFRLAQVGGDGGLYYGPLVDVGSVTSLSAFGRFVYFGGNDENDLGFVGKINLGLFTDDLTPSWSLDLFTQDTSRVLQGAETETIRDIVVLDSAIMWLVENHLWYEVPAHYAVTGELVSGRMTYDLSDPKVFARIQVHMNALVNDEEVDVDIRVDDGAWVPVTTIAGVGEIGGDFTIPDARGGHVAYRLTLRRGDAVTSPVIERITIRALPQSSSGEQIVLPLVLREQVRDLRGTTAPLDPVAEYAALRQIQQAGQLVPVTLWGVDYEAVVDGVQLGPDLEYTRDQQGLQGLCTVILRTFYPLEN